jgi:8-oxo-dGTP pyrophosphatase MutT (NUDIX family)
MNCSDGAASPRPSAASLTAEQIACLLRSAPADPELDALTKANIHLRPAAVLIPLCRQDENWCLLLTRRTDTVHSHKGQVSFPGGAAEPQDTSPEETALREAQEEIGLIGEDVQVLGRLATRPTISNFLVTPVVARISWPASFRLSPDEVSRVFTIPLDWLANGAHWEERPRSTPNGYFEHVIFYQPYDSEVLWGASARITHDLLRVLGLF